MYFLHIKHIFMLNSTTEILTFLKIFFIVSLFCNQKLNNKIIEKFNFLIIIKIK